MSENIRCYFQTVVIGGLKKKREYEIENKGCGILVVNMKGKKKSFLAPGGSRPFLLTITFFSFRLLVD